MQKKFIRHWGFRLVSFTVDSISGWFCESSNAILMETVSWHGNSTSTISSRFSPWISRNRSKTGRQPTNPNHSGTAEVILDCNHRAVCARCLDQATFFEEKSLMSKKPWKINGWFTYKSPMKRKEHDLNQTSMRTCSMLIFRGVWCF